MHACLTCFHALVCHILCRARHVYRNASSTHTHTTRDATAHRPVCVTAMPQLGASCVRASFVGGTISGGACRHLLPRVHPLSPPRRCVRAISGHQTLTRTRMPSRVVMSCGQLSSISATAVRPHLGRRRWLTLRLHDHVREVTRADCTPLLQFL